MGPCVTPLRSLKVIGSDTDRSGSYDFLLVVSNCESRTVCEINVDFGPKTQIFPILVYLTLR